VPAPPIAEPRLGDSAWPRALADAFYSQGQPSTGQVPNVTAPPPPRTTPPSSDIHKLRAEIAHLELLIKKLQTELQIERQYNQALELHVRTLTQVE